MKDFIIFFMVPVIFIAAFVSILPQTGPYEVTFVDGSTAKYESCIRYSINTHCDDIVIPYTSILLMKVGDPE